MLLLYLFQTVIGVLEYRVGPVKLLTEISQHYLILLLILITFFLQTEISFK